MHNSAIGACLVLGLFSACTAQPAPRDVKLDEPVAYNTFSVRGSGSSLQLTVDGAVTLRLLREAGVPRDFTGMTSAAALAALRDDIAAADLGSLSATYTCTASVCDGPTFFRTLIVEVGGETTQIQMDPGVSNTQLPSRLARVLQELDALSEQLSPTTAP
jgi:hypothetical protein